MRQLWWQKRMCVQLSKLPEELREEPPYLKWGDEERSPRSEFYCFQSKAKTHRTKNKYNVIFLKKVMEIWLHRQNTEKLGFLPQSRLICGLEIRDLGRSGVSGWYFLALNNYGLVLQYSLQQESAASISPWERGHYLLLFSILFHGSKILSRRTDVRR